MRRYNCFGDLQFDPADYNPLKIGKISHFLRHDPQEVRRKIQDGEWTVGDLEKAISYVEDFEKDIQRKNPAWEPRKDIINMRDLYKDLLIRIL